MTADAPRLYRGACHCGAVTFEVETALAPATRCNCSLCRRKGALMSPAVPRSQLRILSGEADLTLYQFNMRIAKHYFCKHCGIYPFHQTRTDPTRWRVNLGCLDGVNPYRVESSVADGASLSVVDDA